jgi:hypothetical protein
MADDRTNVDRGYDDCIARLMELLPEHGRRLLLELDEYVGERLVEFEHAGFELARRTSPLVDYWETSSERPEAPDDELSATANIVLRFDHPRLTPADCELVIAIVKHLERRD